MRLGKCQVTAMFYVWAWALSQRSSFSLVRCLWVRGNCLQSMLASPLPYRCGSGWLVQKYSDAMGGYGGFYVRPIGFEGGLSVQGVIN